MNNNSTIKALGALVLFGATALSGTARADAFTFIQAGYTAQVVAVAPSFLGGVAFAADGDILADNCQFGGSALIRWDVQGATTTVHGSTIYSSRTNQASNAGCGLTTHSNGSIYTNTSGGVVKLSDTGTQLGVGGFGGNALGISEDPLTGDLYYVDSSYSIRRVTADLTPVGGVFASNGGFTDGIFWNPDGSKLYTTDRTFPYTVTIFNRDGTLANTITLGSEPDGIAFSTDGFVLTNNTDGTITRINSDGTTSLFASGGFRGDLAHVGADGCWYVTQAGTRYADGTTDGNNSIVRICSSNGGGFKPPPGTDTGGGGTPVPEPGSLLMLSTGLLLGGVSINRRKKKA